MLQPGVFTACTFTTVGRIIDYLFLAFCNIEKTLLLTIHADVLNKGPRIYSRFPKYHMTSVLCVVSNINMTQAFVNSEILFPGSLHNKNKHEGIPWLGILTA